MALKGNLKDFSTTQLLNLIHLARKTGALTLQIQSGVTTLFFREGKLVHTTASGQDGHLASVLARAGKLSEEQAKIIHARAGNQSDKELGMLLSSAGYFTQRDIVNSVRADFLETVYGLFAWSDGLFRLEPMTHPPFRPNRSVLLTVRLCMYSIRNEPGYRTLRPALTKRGPLPLQRCDSSVQGLHRSTSSAASFVV